MAPAFAPTRSLALLSLTKPIAAMASSRFDALKLSKASSMLVGPLLAACLEPKPPFSTFLAPALGAFGFASGMDSSSSLFKRSSSAFLAAAAAAFSALSSALDLPLAPFSQLAASAASALAASASFFLLAVSSLRARPAAAFEFAGASHLRGQRSATVSLYVYCRQNDARVTYSWVAFLLCFVRVVRD